MWGLLFRLPAVVYFIVSGILVIGGTGMFFSMRADDAARTAALKHKPPAEISLDALKPATYKADYNEIVLRAQADPAVFMEQIQTEGSREVGRKLFMPLYPLAAKSLSDQATAVAIVDEKVSDEQLIKLFEGPSAIGGVMVINGTFEGTSDIDRTTAATNMDRNVKLSSNFVVIRPFIHGRATDLAPKGGGPAILIVALFLAVISGAYGFFRKGADSGYEDTDKGYQPGY